MAYQAPKVDQAAYGLWGPANVALQAGRTGHAGRDILRGMNAEMMAGREQQGYLDAMQAANINQLAGSAAENEMELKRALIQQAAPLAQAGIAGAAPLESVGFNQPYLQTADIGVLNSKRAGAFKDRATGLNQLAGTPYMPTQEAVGQILTGPEDTEALPVVPYISYDDSTKRLAAEARAASEAETARAAMIRANKAGAGSEGGVTISFTPSQYGMPDAVTLRGKDPAAIQAAAEQFRGGAAPTPDATTDATMKAKGAVTKRRSKATGEIEYLNAQGQVVK